MGLRCIPIGTGRIAVKRLWPDANQGVSEVGMKDDQIFLKEASNIVECLCNLNYLIGEEAERPEKVRQYASLSDQRLQAMIELLRGE
jgi:hypothetical protein